MIKATPAQAGSPNPLGATVTDHGVNFALYSAHAERVELCLFDEHGKQEITRYALPEQTDGIWHGSVSGLGEGACYGYRVYGPYRPTEGHRFNHHKLLLDPYALAYRGALTSSESMLGYCPDNPRLDLSFDERDSADATPKCIVVDRRDEERHRPLHPRVPWRDTIIYETHVRGYTMNHAGVDPSERGRFMGMANDAVIAHLRALGVSSIELLPVHARLDEFLLSERGLTNYWGYNTIGFFAPDPRFARHNAIDEFKTMVDRLHDAGLEVILDVVYNHSAEGNELGPTLSFRGIDNASYYRLHPDDPRYYINDTGCGNTINVHHPMVVRFIMDSLRYWVQTFGIDGFRFDLAATMGRDAHGFSAAAPLLQCIRQDPLMAHCKLIAEPWDVGPGGYRLGQFGPGWAEWNDKSRDAIRRFWRADPSMAPEFARRVHGSSDLFEQHNRHPWASINFVTSHDGFTLNDVVSYEHRHNEANGEENRDGHSENYSAGYGHEGPADDEEINAIRDRQRRNMLATLLFSQGTPMLLAGDEFGHSQSGNNNAYCQDNATTWLAWQRLEQQTGFLDFVKALIATRKRFTALRGTQYLHSTDEHSEHEPPAIAWYSTQGQPLTADDWENPDLRYFALLLNAKTHDTSASHVGNDDARLILIAFNASEHTLEFKLPSFATRSGSTAVNDWRVVLSTATAEPLLHDGRLIAETRSLTLLQSSRRNPSS